MENVFQFRDQLVGEYSTFSRSFVQIRADDIRSEVERQYGDGRYWPEPLIQINPNYQRKGTVQQLASEGVLHRACGDLFQTGKTEGNPQPLFLYAHQLQALAAAPACAPNSTRTMPGSMASTATSCATSSTPPT